MPHDLFDRVRSNRRDLIDFDHFLRCVQEADLAAVVATSPANVTYTGGALLGLAPLTFVVTTAEGRQAIVINEADAHFFRRDSWVEDFRVYPWANSLLEMHRSGIVLLREVLDEFGLQSSPIGVELAALPSIWTQEIQQGLPGADLRQAGQTFERARLIKTPTEIEVLRQAAYCTDKAISAGFAMMRPGQSTERDLHAEILSNVLRFGADDINHAVALSGPSSTVVHAWSSPKLLAPGDVVHVDIGGTFAGYMTDIGRNAVVVDGTVRQRDIHRRLGEVHHRMVAAVKPGLTAGELFELGENAMREVGLDHPWATFGHSTGLSVHEGFEISRGSQQPFEVGMVINIEPSHIEAGDARYQIEDTFAITADGAETLSTHAAPGELASIRSS